MPLLAFNWWDCAFEVEKKVTAKDNETITKQYVSCKIPKVSADGQSTPCAFTSRDKNATNQKYHLQSEHGIKSADDPKIVTFLKEAEAKSRTKDIRDAFTHAPNTTKSLAACLARATACTGVCHGFWAQREVQELLEAIRKNPQLKVSTDRRTVCEEIIQQADSELEVALEQRRGTNATITIDSGTVVHRYFFVCLHCVGFQPILVHGVPDRDIGDDARLTAENITASLQELLTKLSTYRIQIVATCGDNAANMQAALRALSINGIIPVRCMAHSLNLMYKAAIEDAGGLLFEAWTAAMRVHSQNAQSPRLIETRWNYKFKWMEVVNRIVHEDCNGYDISFLSSSESAKIRDAVTAFDTVCKCIDKLQSDSATFVDVIAVLSDMNAAYATPGPRIAERARREIYAAMLQHGTKLASDTACCLAFFHPGLERSKYPSALHHRIRDFVRTTGSRILNVPEVDMVATFNAALCAAPIIDDDVCKAMTSGEVANFWSLDRDTLRLSAFLTKIANITPTEAAVEREFSKLKLIVDDFRTRLTPENAVATVTLRSLVNARRTEIAVDQREDPKFDARQAAQTVGLWQVVHLQQLPAPQTKATRALTSTCNVCEKHFSEHPDDLAIKCNVCGAYFSYICAKVALELVRDNPTGKCPNCRRMKLNRGELRCDL